MRKHCHDMNELAARYGFDEARPTRGGHLVFQHRVNGRKVFHASSPSESRSNRNFESQLRRTARLPPVGVDA